METMPVDGLTLFFDPQERQAAELMRHACEKSIRLIRACWGLETPQDCRVYVMTSWRRFLFHSSPWTWRILLGVSVPAWYSRVQRLWRIAGGWVQRYGRRVAVGVKPARLVERADRSMGERIFYGQDDMDEKVQQVTCHELVHAFAAHLRLPLWLNEGLAMVTVDRYFQKPTVRYETLEVLRRWAGGTGPGEYRSLSYKDQDAVVYHCVRGYWITRYLEDTRPELLRSLLSQRHRRRALEDKVAAALGRGREAFWRDIDGVVACHFKEEGSSLAE